MSLWQKQIHSTTRIENYIDNYYRSALTLRTCEDMIQATKTDCKHYYGNQVQHAAFDNYFH